MARVPPWAGAGSVVLWGQQAGSTLARAQPLALAGYTARAPHWNPVYVGGCMARLQSLHVQLGSFHTRLSAVFGLGAVLHIEQGGNVHASRQ